MAVVATVLLGAISFCSCLFSAKRFLRTVGLVFIVLFFDIGGCSQSSGSRNHALDFTRHAPPSGGR
eukprot:1587433-Amphidinium_carterae.1